ncbi:pentatricopeptide repeat protein [Microdochium trichocladiopsis]|uniref:Pentatricopeptide repeat protein n=1 Tax=Microdochium trichocladiopsis TaxID=1682393 RepID=A0A9P8YCD8_9PEZI|nr:pentatricopeptide repeat protein [Microdochium trichocladiopsis]KAH7035796.1 pentatricopeptide repeat protein [Microdochium trichocladiopsis]
MPLYSSLYQNLFRQGVAKSLTHGYAQSLVAATHPHVLNSQNRPSFARRNSQRAGPISAFQLHGAFHTVTHNNATLPQDRHHDKAVIQGGLDGYFEALQKHQVAEDAEKEWSFQFQKSIEWKPQAATILGPDADATAIQSEETVAIQAAQADEIARLPIPVDAEAALAHIDAALSKELEARELQEELEERLSSRAPSPALEGSRLPSRSATPAPEHVATPVSITSIATPVDPQSRTYADHLTRLCEDGRYAEIPTVFETMLVAGVQPIAPAYNALLSAAINIPVERNQVVSKALDVYADMKRREIRPDAETYNILVGLLAERSLEVIAIKTSFEQRRLRYGGMEEPGQFMFASTELDFAIVSEDERLDLAMKLFESSVLTRKTNYSSETYHQLITACAQAGRVPDMLRLFDHMELSDVVPFAATFPAMINAFAKTGDLASAVECYNEYKELAVSHDGGKYSLNDRLDAHVYAAVVRAYVVNDRLDGAMRFFEKVVASHGEASQKLQDDVIGGGFVKGFLDRGVYHEALEWAQALELEGRFPCMIDIATAAADAEDKMTAVAAFANVPSGTLGIAKPAMALLAMSIRQGDVPAAARYWDLLSSMEVDATFIEPTAMYAVALIGSGQVGEGLVESEIMLQRIRDTGAEVADEIEEAVDFIASFMASHNLQDPREVASQSVFPTNTFVASPYSTSQTASSYEDTFDPYAHSTDFKGSSLISDELDGAHGRKGPRLGDALARFRNMRRAGRHPRYITYAKLISAAAREGKMDTCHDILSMARTDVPLLPQYAVVRYGWSSILDAMVGACLTLGDRILAEQYHRELLDFGAAPSANTFGLYITSLKESTKTFDEASEAVKIFHRAKAEGVEPSSFLYNALIGKLGKARRIDDCLFYFAEMRSLGIKPTSVTYGTIVNALCRVSDDKFAEELFDEMEAMPNYKARPAPYNSMMQFFLTTKRDKAKVLSYYERMKARGITPTAHTYKLLVDTHATLEPVNITAAEAVLDMIRASGQQPEPVHYSSLIHARGCVLHDLEGARKVFDSVMADPTIQPSACLFQAIFEAMVANHCVLDTEPVLANMRQRRVELTPYIANTLIHGWTGARNIEKAKSVYDSVGLERREPSTYEAMTRAFLSVENRHGAQAVVSEMLSRGYPNAVVNKVLELLGGGNPSEINAV